jgi:PAS domain-containing protein
MGTSIRGVSTILVFPMSHVRFGRIWSTMPLRYKCWETSIEKGVAFDLETRIRRHDGEFRWFLTHAVPIRREGGKISCWFGVSSDINRLKLTEERLRESEERFRLFAEHSTAVIWLLDAETFHIDYLNSAFERVWDEPREAIIRDQARWLETIHPEDRRRAATAGQRVLDREVSSPSSSKCSELEFLSAAMPKGFRSFL